MLKSESQHAFRSFAGNKLDTLNHAVDNHMLNTRIFSLGILADKDGIYIIVWRLVSGDRSAGSNVGEEVKRSAESQVKGDMTFTNRRLGLLIGIFKAQ
jgi:hypothetical protein